MTLSDFLPADSTTRQSFFYSLFGRESLISGNDISPADLFAANIAPQILCGKQKRQKHQKQHQNTHFHSFLSEITGKNNAGIRKFKRIFTLPSNKSF